MKTVTQKIRVELADDERAILSTARNILQNFLDIMMDNSYDYAYFEQFGGSYDKLDLEDTIDLLDAFNEDNPTIE